VTSPLVLVLAVPGIRKLYIKRQLTKLENATSNMRWVTAKIDLISAFVPSDVRKYRIAQLEARKAGYREQADKAIDNLRRTIA